MNKIIEVTNLTKSYGDVKAVKGIDFYVEKGSLFSFLGVNGAGKSTTINMLCTLLKQDCGTANINGYSLGKEDENIKKSIGIVFQDSVLDAELTAKENLQCRGGFYHLSKKALNQRIDEVAEKTQINDFIKRPYGKLSGGQRRRVDIARALINKPEILFLDEPTTGLDPASRKAVWQMVSELQKENNMTVFLTTHYMEEAAQSDYIAIIGGGEILAKGTPIELKQKYAKDHVKIKPINEKSFIEKLSSKNIKYKISGESFHIDLSETTQAIPLIEYFKDNIKNIEILNGTMDDVFINVTQ